MINVILKLKFIPLLIISNLFLLEAAQNTDIDNFVALL